MFVFIYNTLTSCNLTFSYLQDLKNSNKVSHIAVRCYLVSCAMLLNEKVNALIQT